LLNRFDTYIKDRGYVNRSEALRDLIRNALVQEEWEDLDKETVATLTLVYNHHQHDIADRLANIQHQHTNIIISTLHVHLDHANCLEVIVMKGIADEVKTVSDLLLGARGVRHGGVVRTTTGKDLA
jgi:CopG family nickel-responsive transcriptional regulator